MEEGFIHAEISQEADRRKERARDLKVLHYDSKETIQEEEEDDDDDDDDDDDEDEEAAKLSMEAAEAAKLSMAAAACCFFVFINQILLPMCAWI
jgi:phosphopantothenoylcysteine synthetase/decarboxylase